MDCGIPFCNTGCPLGNLIPDWNDHAYKNKPELDIAALHATNNFPEFTGRVCPAPCEAACVLGSGPAGMAAAQQLARAGHDVTLFERDDRIGGLLTYGIPDFKMEKSLVDRRIEQMTAEGVTFKAGIDVGRDVTAHDLKKSFDATVLTIGSRIARDLEVSGRELPGIHYAMDF